ncbi:MAG: hypothetical protein KGI00_02560 [Candidatus Micrarchaeota archaeon]|nr:hypothetical protein [Candidatus Micrarchaeota archaeon]MDE1823792.1 hypothetical protein [Candidatus Micrarchaeota archaeon]MDE1849589.1 hypothetical protein [Candidatus Micrarchaeota archaeon]
MGVGAYQTLELAGSSNDEAVRAIRDLEEYAYGCKESRREIRDFLEGFARSGNVTDTCAEEAMKTVERISAVEMLEMLCDNYEE